MPEGEVSPVQEAAPAEQTLAGSSGTQLEPHPHQATSDPLGMSLTGGISFYQCGRTRPDADSCPEILQINCKKTEFGWKSPGLNDDAWFSFYGSRDSSTVF